MIMGMEIERKYTVKKLPADLENFEYHLIEQGYLNVHPAIRVRQEDDHYYMTYKGAAGVVAKEEYNMELDEASIIENYATNDVISEILVEIKSFVEKSQHTHFNSSSFSLGM